MAKFIERCKNHTDRSYARVSRAARGMGCFCERSQHRDLASERLTIAQNFAAIIRVTAEFSKYWLRDDRAQSDKSRA
jgi:hypothetical protein